MISGTVPFEAGVNSLKGFACFGHVCVFVHGGENSDYWFGVGVGCLFQFCFGSGEGIRSDGAAGFKFKKGSHDSWDSCFEEAGVVADLVCEAVFVYGYVDLLNNSPLN
jgi:hypothetical protein